MKRLLVFASLAIAAIAQTSPFDAREPTIASVHSVLFTHQNSCRDVVSALIARIEAYNPAINAIITVNPEALSDADQLDLSLSAGNATGSLFCIPILLKDNYDLAGIPTTGGSVTLNASIPVADAPAVVAFRNAGAIILGKTNLHEFALEGLSVSSLGGQTVNPYDFSRTPGGSSGGTGAAIAASLAVFGTGRTKLGQVYRIEAKMTQAPTPSTPCEVQPAPTAFTASDQPTDSSPEQASFPSLGPRTLSEPLVGPSTTSPQPSQSCPASATMHATTQQPVSQPPSKTWTTQPPSPAHQPSKTPA